jgi:hypothetical protein
MWVVVALYQGETLGCAFIEHVWGPFTTLGEAQRMQCELAQTGSPMCDYYTHKLENT